MPDSTIYAPVAADAVDRLTLGSTDARAAGSGVAESNFASATGHFFGCMAEE
jgi:hypothetical protein